MCYAGGWLVFVLLRHYRLLDKFTNALFQIQSKMSLHGMTELIVTYDWVSIYSINTISECNLSLCEFHGSFNIKFKKKSSCFLMPRKHTYRFSEMCKFNGITSLIITNIKVEFSESLHI